MVPDRGAPDRCPTEHPIDAALPAHDAADGRLAYDWRAPSPPEEHATSRTTRKVEGVQNISRMCLVCGTENAFGLHARFYELAAGREGGGPEILGIFTPREEHQSYPGRLHGGVSSAILDETIGRAILTLEPGAWGVTAEFKVRFRKPLPLDEDIRCIARITRDSSRIFEGSGEIVLADGSVAVEATGKYVKMPITDIAAAEFVEREWFADLRERPGEVEV